MDEIILPYSATGISIFARFIFMYLLYTKKSTNTYSLIFCIMNLASSSLWMNYGIKIQNQPLLIRSYADLVLFSISAVYIIYNKMKLVNRIGINIDIESNIDKN